MIDQRKDLIHGLNINIVDRCVGKNKIKVGDIIVHKTKIVARPPIRDVINNVEVDEVEVDENDVVKYVEVRNLYGASQSKCILQK